MTTSSDPFGWPDAPATSPSPAAMPSPSQPPAVVDDPRFTPERAEQLLDEDREVERRLAWKEALALVVVLLVVLLRFTWFS
jgi:hypothetical protein